MPKVSVVIPFYNRADWLSEAVDSVLNQTYTDFELIIVDDGSMEEYTPPCDSRIRYIRQENRGPGAARNTGMMLARGEYIAFLDADDLFLPSKLERQVALMAKHPDALLSHTSYIRVDRDGKELETMDSGTQSAHGRLTEGIVFDCRIATPTVMIRPQLDLRFEATKAGLGEDIVMWHRFAARSCVVGLDEPLSKVRMHGLNLSKDAETQAQAGLHYISALIGYGLPLSHQLRCKVFLYLYDFHRELKYLLSAMCAWPFNARAYPLLGRYLWNALKRRARTLRGKKNLGHA